MLSLALEKQMFVFTKDDMAKVGGMFLKTKLDGGSIMALMGSTSGKDVPLPGTKLWVEMIKLRPGGRLA
jgi:hypothetical protein